MMSHSMPLYSKTNKLNYIVNHVHIYKQRPNFIDTTNILLFLISKNK